MSVAIACFVLLVGFAINIPVFISVIAAIRTGANLSVEDFDGSRNVAHGAFPARSLVHVVVCDFLALCGQCARCLEGNTNLCPRIAFSGNAGLDGGLCEVMSWPTHAVVPLPDGMTAEDAAMLEPLGVAVHAWDLGHVKLGDRVAVVGAGPIGLKVLITSGDAAAHPDPSRGVRVGGDPT